MARRPARMSAEAVEQTLRAAAAHYAAGRLDEAARGYAAVEAADPRDHRAVYSLAVVDIGRGRLPEALVRLKRVVKLEPDLFPAQFNLGRVSEVLGDWRGAGRGLWAGGRAQARGDRRGLLPRRCAGGERADRRERRPLPRSGADPRLGPQALARLALIRPESVTDAELAEIRRAAEDAAVAAETRIGLRFALGEVLEAREADDEAFAAFAAGNQAKHARARRAGPASDPRNVARVTARSIAPGQGAVHARLPGRPRGEGDRAPRRSSSSACRARARR